MILLTRGLAALILSIAPLLAGAATFGEEVMAPGLLAALPQGETLEFRHSRALPEAGAEASPPPGGYRRLGPEAGQTIRIAVAEPGGLALQQGGRTVAEFPAGSPHPVLLMFLENVMRSVAQETGGNPHYIRNRMRHALGAAQVSGGRLLITPFAEDPNRDRLGVFATLQIDIRWQEADPGRLLQLSATLPEDPARYSEILTAAAKDAP